MSEDVLRPTPKTIKRLFAKSGNRCAWKNCSEPIITEQGTVVGKIAHIEGESVGGPRHNPQQTAEQRRAYENLILLCGRHHDDIDDMPELFTVEVIKEIKRKHEHEATEVEDLVEIAEAAAQLSVGSVSVKASNASNSTIAGVIRNSTINNYSPSPSAETAGPYRGKKPAVGLGRFTSEATIGKRSGSGFVDAGGELVTFPQSGACAWFRIWPAVKPLKPYTMLALQDACGQGRSLDLITFYGTADRLLTSSDGIGRYNTFDGFEATAVAFLFRSGEIWCVDRSVVDHDYVNVAEVRKHFPMMLAKYTAILSRLGASGPYHWQFGLEGVDGFELSYETIDHASRYSLPRLTADVILVEGVHPSSPDESLPLRAVTEEIFAECGELIPPNLR